jgi:hypothetical protein
MTWREHFGAKRRGGRQFGEGVRLALAHNVSLKLLSVLAAFAVWVFVNFGERESEAAFQVPLELRNIPANIILVSPRVDFVDLRVKGPRTLLGRIDRDQLAIGLDVGDVRPGPSVFRILPGSLDLPRGVTVVRLAPSEVTFEWARTASKTVPVKLELTGRPPNDLRVTNTEVAPQSVKVFGPEREVAQVDVASTVPLDLSNTGPGLIERDLALAMPREYVSYSAALVRAQVRLEEPGEIRTLKRVPIVVRNSAYRAVLRPSRLNVTVRGPRSKIESLELTDGAVYIDSVGREPGEYQEVPAVDLPAGVTLVKLEPDTVWLRLTRETGK